MPSSVSCTKSAALSMHEVSLPWAAWFGDYPLKLNFPEAWEVHVCTMRDAPALSAAEIRAALQHTIATRGWRELLQGCQSVAIAVDDLSRPTPTHALLPFLLEELFAGGIRKEN